MKKITPISLKSIILAIILLLCFYYAYQFYQLNNFNDFIRSELNLYTSEFTRDKEVKYSKNSSYKIQSDTYNDAMFYQTISVEKNTPYKVTCMVKTRQVTAENNSKGVGAHIAIEGTTQRSIAISGTQDWQKIELLFNSQNKENMNIGFRLGGYLGNAKGEAWFSDFTLEKGEQDTSKGWKFACFIFNTTDVTVNEKNIKIDITQQDQKDIQETIHRFETACEELSQGKMKANCDILNIDTPLNQLSYDEQFGYFVAPEDIEEQIKNTIATGNYDHIFAIIRLGNEEHQEDIQINDWIGLGSMDYYGIGFSNIRLPNSSKSYIYKYNTKINTFPEEVFLHEFLHSLERNAQENGYEIPALHDYQKYGYEEERLQGQKKWYVDYMNQEIVTQEGKKIGLPIEVYTMKPAKNKEFNQAELQQQFKEPQNMIEEVKGIVNNFFRNIEYMTSTQKENQKYYFKYR